MAVTPFQAGILRLIAKNRIAGGELSATRAKGGIVFHEGRSRGAWPRIIG